MFSILIFIFRFLPFLYLLGVLLGVAHNIKNVQFTQEEELKLNGSFQLEMPNNTLGRFIIQTLFGGRKGAVLLILGILAWFVAI